MYKQDGDGVPRAVGDLICRVICECIIIVLICIPQVHML